MSGAAALPSDTAPQQQVISASLCSCCFAALLCSASCTHLAPVTHSFSISNFDISLANRAESRNYVIFGGAAGNSADMLVDGCCDSKLSVQPRRAPGRRRPHHHRSFCPQAHVASAGGFGPCLRLQRAAICQHLLCKSSAADLADAANRISDSASTSLTGCVCRAAAVPADSADGGRAVAHVHERVSDAKGYRNSYIAAETISGSQCLA